MENRTKFKENLVNVAPSSTEGHYIKDGNVVELDNENETFFVEGKSELKTKNHTTLKNTEDVLITCQNVYDPVKGVFEKARD